MTENENERNWPFGRKQTAMETGYASPGGMPPGILGRTPLAQHAPNRASSPNELPSGVLPASGCLNADPHPREAGGGTSGIPSQNVQRKNTFMSPNRDRTF
jgi:hypothetical protein